MPTVTFYLLSDAEGQPADDNASAHLHSACEVAAQQFRLGQRVYVYCENKQQAEAVDELLWQRPVDAFVPHNLTGEGPPNGAPIEIIWQAPNRVSRPVCINLHSDYPGFAEQCRFVFDFVPTDEALKQQSRERYKHYRAAGFQLDTQPAASLNENKDG